MANLHCSDRIMRTLTTTTKIFSPPYPLKPKIREGINIGGMEWGWERVKDRLIADTLCVDRMMRTLTAVSPAVLPVIRAGSATTVNPARRTVSRSHPATNRDSLTSDIQRYVSNLLKHTVVQEKDIEREKCLNFNYMNKNITEQHTVVQEKDREKCLNFIYMNKNITENTISFKFSLLSTCSCPRPVDGVSQTPTTLPQYVQHLSSQNSLRSTNTPMN